MTNKTLGLLLVPLLPLSALGIVEVASHVMPADQRAQIVECQPTVERAPRRESAPPVVRYETQKAPAIPAAAPRG